MSGAVTLVTDSWRGVTRIWCLPLVRRIETSSWWRVPYPGGGSSMNTEGEIALELSIPGGSAHPDTMSAAIAAQGVSLAWFGSRR